jgi:hypothetical protein
LKRMEIRGHGRAAPHTRFSVLFVFVTFICLIAGSGGEFVE